MLQYTKLQKLLIIIIITITLASCDNNKIELTQEQYKELIGDTIKPEYPKNFKFKSNWLNSNHRWYIELAEDNHEYLRNEGHNTFILIHYPDCIKCKKDTL